MINKCVLVQIPKVATLEGRKKGMPWFHRIQSLSNVVQVCFHNYKGGRVRLRVCLQGGRVTCGVSI